MKHILLLIAFNFLLADDARWFGCTDESALNYNPWAFWDCGDCCEYEDESEIPDIVINEIHYN